MEATANELLDQVTRAAEQRRLSENTIAAYRRTWLKAIAWSSAEGIALSTLSRAQAEGFYFQITRDRSAAHHLQVKAALQLLYKTLDAVNPFSQSRAPKFIIEDTEIRCLSSSQLTGLLLTLRQTANTYFGRLTYHLSSALFYTACHFHQWAHLTVDDLLFNEAGRLERVQIRGQSNKLRHLAISVPLAESLAEWFEFLDGVRGMRLRGGGLEFAGSRLVFPGRDGMPPSNQALNRRLAAACRRANVPVISSYGLRHSAARLLLEDQAGNLTDLQTLLGHVSIGTTTRYSRAEERRHPSAPGDLPA